MAFNREDFLSKAKQPREITKIEIPEWGGEVNLRMLNAGERSKLEYAVTKAIETKSDNVRALFAVASVCNNEGDPLFSNEDIPLLNSLDWRVLERILKETGTFNEMGLDALEAAEKK